jgi:hypothetical protein
VAGHAAGTASTSLLRITQANAQTFDHGDGRIRKFNVKTFDQICR